MKGFVLPADGLRAVFRAVGSDRTIRNMSERLYVVHQVYLRKIKNKRPFYYSAKDQSWIYVDFLEVFVLEPRQFGYRLNHL